MRPARRAGSSAAAAMLSATAAIGITIGVVGALAMSRALNALLFGISATDPITFVVAAAALALAAVAAAYAPACRAGRIDPVVLLR